VDGGTRRRMVTEDSAWYIPGPPHGPATVPEPPTAARLSRVVNPMGDAMKHLMVVAWEGLTVLSECEPEWGSRSDSDKEGAD
jgi:hypothetical protein